MCLHIAQNHYLINTLTKELTHYTNKVIYMLIPCEVGVVVGIHGVVVEGTIKATWIMHATSFIDTRFIT